jgi:hypothetical protein
MLLYSLLYLTGYDLSLEELENFRRWGSRTPGHPEYGVTLALKSPPDLWVRVWQLLLAWPWLKRTWLLSTTARS